MKTFLSIDFGTSQTSVAMLTEKSRYEPEIIEVDGQKTIPTALRLDGDGNVLFFGKDAVEKFHDDSGQTFYNFKAFIGRNRDYQAMSNQNQHTPESLSLIFLTYLREKIEKRYFNGAKLTEDPDIFCVIGCPAEWNDPQKRKVEDIARQAGFPNAVHCEEPLGVIYYYHFRGDLDLSEDRNVLVYDFGGGTTDVAIEKVHASDNGAVGVDVLAANGIANLGGMYFDRALSDFFIGKLGLDPEKLSLRDRQQIERYSREAKEELSRRVEDGHNSAEVSIPMLRATKSSCTLSITRDEFNTVCAGFISQFDEPIYEALNFSMLMQDKVDRVILAGGSSALPYVRESITAIFPNGKVLASASPTEVIAKGLAVYGRIIATAKNSDPASQTGQHEEQTAAPLTVPLKKEQPAAKRSETRPEESKTHTAKNKPDGTGRSRKIWLAVAAAFVLAVGGAGFVHMQNKAAQAEKERAALQAQIEQAERERKETENKATALYNDGMALERGGKLEAALKKYRESYALWNVPGVMSRIEEVEKTIKAEKEKAERERLAREEAARKEKERKRAEQAEIEAGSSVAKLNSKYSGKYLGSSFTSTQSAAIRAGTFDGMALGDYWTIDYVNWRIADFDYLIRVGKVDKSKHHLMIVPDKALDSSRMNKTNTTGGGYANSYMRRYGLAHAKDMIEKAFGSGHILTNYGVELMTYEMVFSNGNRGVSLFQHNKDFILLHESPWWYWLQDVRTKSCFVYVFNRSTVDYDLASHVRGVRPAFAIH